MGVSDSIVIPFYKKNIVPLYEPIALLGFANNNVFLGDLYDRELGNWDINNNWKLDKKYSTIICTRCAYFAKNPIDFIDRCHNSLTECGNLYVDWALGDHWRFKDFKVGWKKNGEQEYAYGESNYLWSCIWDDSFLENAHCKDFEFEINKSGYNSLRQAVIAEVPSLLRVDEIDHLFDVEFKFLLIKKPYLQLYILMKGIKKNANRI